LSLYGTIFIIIECITIIPISSFYVDPEVLRKSITSKNPSMDFFFETEPSIFGYDPALNDQLSDLYLICIIVGFVILTLFSIIMYFNFIRLMKRNKHKISLITYQ